MKIRSIMDIYKPCWLKVEVPPTEIELMLYKDAQEYRYVIADLTSQIRKKHLVETINLFLGIYKIICLKITAF